MTWFSLMVDRGVGAGEWCLSCAGRRLVQHNHRVAAGLLAVALGVFSACQPAMPRRREAAYPRSEPPSYYSRGGQPDAEKARSETPTQRIESMGQPRKRVLVLDFWNDTPVRAASSGWRQGDPLGESEGAGLGQAEGDALGSFSADELRRGLVSSGRVLLPSEAGLARATADFVQGEQIKVAQLIREGRRAGVSALVIGRIGKIVFRQRGDEIGLFRQKQSLAAADVELKVFDVTSGREVAAFGRSGESSANALLALEAGKVESREYRHELIRLAIRGAVNHLVPEVLQAVEKMTWEGHVAKVAGKKVYVNAGRASGLSAGDILKVLTAGDDIYDSTTGAHLGRSSGQLKGTLEIVDFVGTDGAVGEIHTGGNFQEGDPVRLY